jgi:hypothetical protein
MMASSRRGDLAGFFFGCTQREGGPHCTRELSRPRPSQISYRPRSLPGRLE